MKTVSVALVLCLNVGVDPPDVVKPNPCARLEAWVDPLANSSVKAVEKIGDALQKQYERWQPRARYKQSLDPTIDDIKKLCVGMRKSSKDERVLFHYNGHGKISNKMDSKIDQYYETAQKITLSISRDIIEQPEINIEIIIKH